MLHPSIGSDDPIGTQLIASAQKGLPRIAAADGKIAQIANPISSRRESCAEVIRKAAKAADLGNRDTARKRMISPTQKNWVIRGSESSDASMSAIELPAQHETKMVDLDLLNLSSFLSSIEQEACSTRRNLLLTPLLAALPLALSGTTAVASPIDPSQTQVTLPDAIKWSGWINGFPPHSGEMAPLYGDLNQPGPYLVLMKWYPGYMSAPHTYVTDRLSLVLSGTWWVNSGSDFDPDRTVPVPAGGFVRRVAHTPHYDGVKKDASEPAVIGLFGIAPVQFKLVDPSKPAWRKL
jgi:hypothetical protein